MLGIARRLRERGVLGINRRNAHFTLIYNARRLYPLVDDKRLTKELAVKAGMAVPALYAVVEAEAQVRHLHDGLARYQSFVVKPAHGSGGDGILVVDGRMREYYRRANGELMTREDFEHHVSNVLSGLFSLGGQPDSALVEYRVHFAAIFEHIAYQGVPDIRIIVFRGIPVMAMARLPTRDSDGKANLHQGAVGVGIDLATGETLKAVWHDEIIDEHPDTGQRVTGISIPGWDGLLESAARCLELTGLGYVGVDFVIDRDLGPLILELNARPGLNIQIANGVGLEHRLAVVEGLKRVAPEAAARVAFARERFGPGHPA